MKTTDLLKTFSEPQRLRILNLLQNSELTVTELVEILSLSQSNISHHLKILKDQNLIEYNKKGSQKFYKALEKPDFPANLLKIWEEIRPLVKEPEETPEDERNLLKVLNQRKGPDITQALNYWRKQQHDQIFTADLALGGIQRAGSALDIGCGTGEFLKVIAGSFDLVIGIDNSRKQLIQAMNQIGDGASIESRAGFLQCDAENLPFVDESFNAIYYRLVLGFLGNPGQSLLNAVRVIKKNGRISIIDQKGKTGSLNQAFFKEFCNKSKNVVMLKYQDLDQLFLCVLEKK